MSAPVHTPSIRDLLLDAACERLAKEGVAGLQARVIASDVGVSTTALYTHFGNIGGLVAAVSQVSLRRFSDAITSAGITDDPVADMLAMGMAYRNFAITNRHEYELMFNHAVLRVSRGVRADVADVPKLLETPEGLKAYNHILGFSTRLVESGVTRPLEAHVVSTGLWSALHGFVLLEILGHFLVESSLTIFGSIAFQMFMGLGIPPERLQLSMANALTRVTMLPSPARD